MTTSQKKGLAAAALVAPFVVFVVSLLISPPVAGTLAGATLSRLVDPIAIVPLAGGLIVGAAGFKWWFAPLIGLGFGVVGVLMAYDFWLKVAGREAAGGRCFTAYHLGGRVRRVWISCWDVMQTKSG